jgi:phage shock protein PspC (stress-responsive transcriptional regulator)
MLGGVCAGLGNYFNIDATIVRLLFVLLVVMGGSGVLLYIILWIIMPREDLSYPSSNLDGAEFGRRAQQMGDEMRDAFSRPNPRALQFLGIGLLVMGVWYLLQNLNIPFIGDFNRIFGWPLLLVVAGGLLLWRAFRKE